MTEAPQYFVWNAEQSVMTPRRKSLADRTYIDGQEYRLGAIEERSTNSHAHFFAQMHECWLNLSEADGARFPSDEALRKHALISTGYFHSQEFLCDSKREALRLAAFLRTFDDYAVVLVSNCAVRRLTAKSQSYRAMAKDEFQASKTAVLEFVSTMISVKPETLSNNAGKSA